MFVLIYEFIDNHLNNIKENEILSNLVFDNDFEQISIIKHIMSGKIENFQQIKLKSLSIKYKNPIHEINEQNDSNINNNNRKESLITSLIKGSAFRNSSISKNNTHYSVSISNKITTRISKIEPRKKNSENIIAKIKEDKKKSEENSRKKNKNKEIPEEIKYKNNNKWDPIPFQRNRDSSLSYNNYYKENNYINKKENKNKNKLKKVKRKKQKQI